MQNRDFLDDWPGRRDKAFKPGLSRLKRDIWYAQSIAQIKYSNLETEPYVMKKFKQNYPIQI